MCGIAGIINLKETSVDKNILVAMTNALTSRGPDDEGYFVAPHVGLGHRRLSIIDLSSGHQPMHSADGILSIVFNGEIYNFLELRATLEKSGSVFHTRSDTEVLLEMYRRRGAGCVQELNGMFAFAIWDAQKKELFAARDRMGKKPFYYALCADHFIFASELKALLKFPSLARAIDPQALQHFFAYEYVPAPLAIIKGVNKLKQAHTLALRQGQVLTSPYWNQEFGGVDDDERAASHKVLDLLDRATSYRLIADVPLGVFLSGGIDSSTVVALMARHRAGKDIKTFAINFKEASYDESLYSQTVAKHFGTDHHEKTLTATLMLEILPRVCDYLDEPFADGSILPTYLLAEFTREHVTVALGGDGGDELLAGYPTFLASRLARTYRRLPAFIQKGLVSLVDLLPVSDKNLSLDFKLKQFLIGATYENVLANQVWLGAFSPSEQKTLYSHELQTQLVNPDVLELVRQEMHRCQAIHSGDRLSYFYQKFYLSDDILFKVDRASMAHSLEVRAPFLDPHVVDYVCRLPFSYKLKGVTTKYILKKALNRLLPALITQRPKKGFGIPISSWLKNELKPLMLETLNERRIVQDGLFNWDCVRALIDGHLAGKRNNRKQLFSLLMFHWWKERYGGGC